MTSGEDEGLFGALPGQAAPQRVGGGAPRLRFAERRQVEWRSISIDELVPGDHRVRMVWSFVEGLDLSVLHTSIKAVEGHPGHPPLDPRISMALWLYATVEGVGSARELGRLCKEHVAFQWLCGGADTNAKTLSDFRMTSGAVLEQLLVDSFTALIRAGVASLDRVAQDGVRVRAAAGAASFRRRATLQECHHAAGQAVRDLRSELEADPSAGSKRRAAARRRAAVDREQRVRKALTVTEMLHAQQQEKTRRQADRAARKARTAEAPKTAVGETSPPRESKPKEPRASTTDAQARVMKMADGGFRPAYNVQFASDTKSGAVLGVTVDNIGSDMGQMAPMNDAIANHYGQRPRQHLADGGFAKLDDIEALAENGVACFVPVPTPRDTSRDRFAPLPGDPPGVKAWRERMSSDDAKTIYKERAATAECANAQARNRGLTQFLVRGLDKVKTIALWHALTHNMVCSWRLMPA